MRDVITLSGTGQQKRHTAIKKKKKKDAREVKAWTDRLGGKSRPEEVALIFFSCSFIDYMNKMPKSPGGIVSMFFFLNL